MAAGPVGWQALNIMLDLGIAPVLAVLNGDLNEQVHELRLRLSQAGVSDVVISAEDEPPVKLAALIRELGVDIGILAWWPRIISEPLLSAPRQGFLNFHPSLLPYNRGKHTTFWNLVEDVPFGVTIHWVDSGIDSGPIAFQRAVPKSWLDTSESLYHRAEVEILQLFRQCLPDIALNRIPRVAQDASGARARHSREIESAARLELERSVTARQLLNVIRAKQFPPHLPAFFEDGGEVFDVRISIERRQK